MLGVHFAISAPEEKSLLAAAESDGESVGELLEEIEETADDVGRLKVDTDKAWDAIHRCLTDGSLDPDAGEHPLNQAVLGGRHLHEEYYAVLVEADAVREVAAALRGIDREWLRGRFDAIDDPEYAGSGDDEDFEYTWSNFIDVQEFYARAAEDGRAVIFTAM